MKCKKCGVLIRDGIMRCDYCGENVRIDPVKNDFSSRIQRRGSEEIRNTQMLPKKVGSKTSYMDSAYETNPYSPRATRTSGNSFGDTGYIKDSKSYLENSYTQTLDKVQKDLQAMDEINRVKHRTEVSGEKKELSPKEKARRRHKALQRKRAKQQKARLILAGICVLILLTGGGISYIIYSNSYKGILADANKNLNNSDYNKAIIALNKAIKKDDSQIEAYEILRDIYMLQDDNEKAKELILNAVSTNPSQVNMYILLIEFYLETDQAAEIMPLLNNCKDENILNQLEEYRVEAVEFSLEEDFYEDVQELSLNSLEETIYYTLDGSEVTEESLVYENPIQISEGITTIQAMSVSKGGIPGAIVTRVITVELPVEGAPVVTPSTGQYDVNTEITVQVPQGYTAYYTLDGSEPTENSVEYTKAVAMPTGNTIFSAVLINKNGKASEITKRNYELTINN